MTSSSRSTVPNGSEPALGSLDIAETIAQRAAAEVPAYRHFLASRNISPGTPFTGLPRVDKANYLSQHDFATLMGGDFTETFTIFKSSGSSGHSFYWPQRKDNHRFARQGMQNLLEQIFQIDRKPTLAVVGLALGSWIGGEHLSWLLKSVAMETPYPFAVFSPGSQHREIIEVTVKASRFVDQIIVVVCPSAIGHLMLLAEQSGQALPLEKMRFIVVGEAFPEMVRLGLHKRCGRPLTEPMMVSMYGSADTGALGVESGASIAVRQILAQDQMASRALGFGASPPHFFHSCAPDAYLESIRGELCVTRWQGIPLVRYNLHDSVTFYRWAAFRKELLARRTVTAAAPELFAVLEAAGDKQPDLIAVAGRSDSGLILCGTNLSETMLDAAVRSPELQPWVTGQYKARITIDDDRQFLEFDLEFLKEVTADAATLDKVYQALVQAIGREQPEFLDDWRNIYSTWDRDPERRILRLRPFVWPELSQRIEKEMKQRGVQVR
ncbi:MAG: hypothetical protein ACREJ2_14545 [Planctomycetota bacterium]